MANSFFIITFSGMLYRVFFFNGLCFIFKALKPKIFLLLSKQLVEIFIV